ncbi:MAG: ABC transporter permease, partial [Actinomycetota bacterium]|nr:ABC transporter permease [Actinomycetota bacterium]
GLLVALGVMAMTVGLIRSEATGDLRVLSAAGATSSNRRTLTAATAGGLALLGALLGIAGAYLALGAAHIRDLSALTPVPLFHLAGIGIGLPLVAAGAGWLLAGREPEGLARAAD